MRSIRDRPPDWIVRRRLHGLLLRGARPKKPEEVVAHLTAMQAQEHAYARWSVVQRMSGLASAASIDAAFDEGSVLRTHILRPTWHYVAAHDLRWLMRFSGPRVDGANARRHEELGLDARTLDRTNVVIADAVADGDRTRRELAAALEQRGISVGGQRVAYMLMHAELTAVICSGAMRGTQYTYAAFDRRVPAAPELDEDEALAELTWRYFSTRGPATLADFSWWSGLRAAEARRGLQLVQARLSSREIDGRTYWLSEPSPRASGSRIDLVQCYDELIISYRQSRDLLQTPVASFPVPRHLDGFQHVLLLDGRLLGHWRATTGSGGVRIETRIRADLDEEAQIALADAIERYRRFAQQR